MGIIGFLLQGLKRVRWVTFLLLSFVAVFVPSYIGRKHVAT